MFSPDKTSQDTEQFEVGHLNNTIEDASQDFIYEEDAMVAGCGNPKTRVYVCSQNNQITQVAGHSPEGYMASQDMRLRMAHECHLRPQDMTPGVSRHYIESHLGSQDNMTRRVAEGELESHDMKLGDLQSLIPGVSEIHGCSVVKERPLDAVELPSTGEFVRHSEDVGFSPDTRVMVSQIITSNQLSRSQSKVLSQEHNTAFRYRMSGTNTKDNKFNHIKPKLDPEVCSKLTTSAISDTEDNQGMFEDVFSIFSTPPTRSNTRKVVPTRPKVNTVDLPNSEECIIPAGVDATVLKSVPSGSEKVESSEVHHQIKEKSRSRVVGAEGTHVSIKCQTPTASVVASPGGEDFFSQVSPACLSAMCQVADTSETNLPHSIHDKEVVNNTSKNHQGAENKSHVMWSRAEEQVTDTDSCHESVNTTNDHGHLSKTTISDVVTNVGQEPMTIKPKLPAVVHEDEEVMFSQISPTALNVIMQVTDSSSNQSSPNVMPNSSNTEKKAQTVTPLRTPIKWKNSVAVAPTVAKPALPDSNIRLQSLNSSVSKQPASNVSKLSVKRKPKRFSYPTFNQITDTCPKKVFNFQSVEIKPQNPQTNMANSETKEPLKDHVDNTAPVDTARSKPDNTKPQPAKKVLKPYWRRHTGGKLTKGVV